MKHVSFEEYEAARSGKSTTVQKRSPKKPRELRFAKNSGLRRAG